MTDRTALADELEALHRFTTDPNGLRNKGFHYTAQLLDLIPAIIGALRAEPAKPVDREAVARALCKSWNEEMAEEARLLHEYYEPTEWTEWLPQADAAIAAMGTAT